MTIEMTFEELQVLIKERDALVRRVHELEGFKIEVPKCGLTPEQRQAFEEAFRRQAAACKPVLIQY